MANERVEPQLRSILADLYPEVAQANLIGQDAGVRMGRVALTGSALNMWDALLREAVHNQRLPALLTIVSADYPTNPALIAAISAYQASAKLATPAPADSAIDMTPASTLAPPPTKVIAAPAPELQQHGLAWLQPFLTIDELERLTQCLAEFVQSVPNPKAVRDAAESVADLEKRFVAYNPTQLVDEALRGRILLCSVGFRPLPVILTTLIIQPKKLYLLHSPDSRPQAETVCNDTTIQAIAHLSSKDIHLKPMSLTDAPKNYALLQEIINENPGQAFVVDISGGVKVMGTSLAAAAFWLRIPVIYQLGEEVASTIKPFSERLIQLQNPFVHFGSAELHSICELFSHAEYDAALAVCRNLSDTTGDRGILGALQILTDFIHVYRDWDAFGHSRPTDDMTRKLATRLQKVVRDMQRLGVTFANGIQVQQNIDFLRQIEQSWQAEQRNQIDPYRLVDIFASAQRRAASGKYDDAVARLYRCLEMSASFCLLNECALGDAKAPVFDYFIGLFGSLDSLSAEFAKQARYPLPTVRLGLNDQMNLLSLSTQPTHKTIAGIYRGMERDGLLEMRNRSILAHGTVSVGQAEYELFEKKSADILSRVMGDKQRMEALLLQATHPTLTVEL